ncbi:putative short chain dehydrogenase reductase family protein [Seiridium unicorne]|uniref:Short chain dehydrogenase reductase family protein n=1 Tax=Seiridium unicorne TaxID=138068 RepID=A0ABR2V8L0_9PEZI
MIWPPWSSHIALAKAGAKSIVIFGRWADRRKVALATFLAIASPEVTVLYEPVDLLNQAQMLTVLDSIAQKVGKIDVLISNAGVYGNPGPMALLAFQASFFSF